MESEHVAMDRDNDASDTRGVACCKLCPPKAAAIGLTLRDLSAALNNSDERNKVAEANYQQLVQTRDFVSTGILTGYPPKVQDALHVRALMGYLDTFWWCRTQEGHAFWAYVYERLRTYAQQVADGEVKMGEHEHD